MKIAPFFVTFQLSIIAVCNSKSLRGGSPNGQLCTMCPDDDDYIYPIEWRKLKANDPMISSLSSAAEKAKYEATFLQDAANMQTNEDKKARLLAAAEAAQYEASILEEALANGSDSAERLLKEKTLPNGQLCTMCPDDDDYIYPIDWRKLEGNDLMISSLKTAAEKAKYEAAFLEDAAEMQTDHDKKARLLAAADAAKYESVILEESLANKDGSAERLLKDKLLPNGQLCTMCPDDDDYIYPIDWRKLEADEQRNLKGKTALPNGQLCTMCPDDDDYIYPIDWRKLEADEQRNLKGKTTLPNGQLCTMCPDDDDYIYPIEWRKLEAE